MLKAITLATVAAVTLTAASIAPDQAFARSRGGAVAAGVGAGLVAGAIIGSAASQRSYYSGPAYAEPYYQPVYSSCRTEREYVTDAYGNSLSRRIRVCD